MLKRSYQYNQIDTIFEQFEKNRTVLGQLPTGGGKTVELSLIAQRFTRENPGQAVMILVHRDILMYQIADTIRSIMDIEPELITSKSTDFRISRVYIGMVESTLSRLHLVHNLGMIIIDECHVGNFNKVHDEFLTQLILGFSASPIATSKKDPLNNYYQCIVTGPQIKELISMGFLAQNVTRCPKDAVDASKFTKINNFGDYDERQMAIEYSSVKNVLNTVKKYFKYCKGTKTIIFNVNIEHSKEVTQAFIDCGYNARHLDGKSKDRKEVLKWFKETPDAILCNVGIANVGFDEPTIQSVILNFSTLSLVKFLQCCGRGGRIIDDWFIEKYQSLYPYILEKKYHFNIIDMGGNYIRFGDWNDDRDWDYLFNNPTKPNEGIAPVKTCPGCDGLIHASLTVCPLTNEKGELCLHEFEKKRTLEQMDLEEMILVTKGINLTELNERYKNKYQDFPMLELAVDVVKDLYEKYETPNETQKVKYFEIYYNLCKEWYSKTLAGKDGNIKDISNSAFYIKRAKNNFDNLVEKHKNCSKATV